MIRLLSVMIILSSAFIFVGCSTSSGKAFSNGSPQLVASPDKVSGMLAQAADRASSALETLASVEYARTPTQKIAPVTNAPLDLRRAVTVNWIGPAEVITKTVSDRAGYKFVSIGSVPPVPLIVSLDAQNTPVIDVLRDIGLQLGARADIKVISQTRVIELRYAPDTGVAGGL